MIYENILNIDNKPYVNNVYHIQIGAYRCIDVVVFANDAGEALDIVIDYYEGRKLEYPGYFFTAEELEEEDDIHLEDCIYGGNHGTHITFTIDELHITEQSADDVVLYVDLSNFN